MNIKTKLRLGFGFLFLVIIGFGGISLYHINQIANRSTVILKDNYKSLTYVNDMRTALDKENGEINTNNAEQFEKTLKLEENNITEKGEKEAVIDLRNAFTILKNSSGSLAQRAQAINQIRTQLRNIDEMNMNAIVRKNNEAQKSTEKATVYLSVTAFVSFLILFTFIVNFPSFIANPLKELLDGIKEISRKNYRQKLEFKGNDEFSELALAFNKMALELRNWDNSNVAKLISEKQRIETIIEQMQDAIIGLNEQQEILFLNKVASELLNLKTEIVVGQNAEALAQKNDLLRKLLFEQAGEEPLKIFANNKESYFTLEGREIIIPNFEDPNEQALIASGKSAGKVYILKNVTKFKELDQAKTNFIATVSHELKTPLSSIKMSLKLLNDQRVGEMNEEQNQLVNHINEDSERLLKITSELLDLAQVETGNLQLSIVKTNPIEIVNVALDAVRLQAAQKEIALVLNCEGNLPSVNADLQKTAWVMVNFLSNALRYSAAKSKIIISVDEKDNFITFSVKDFGKGIEEQYQQRLFDRYYQVPTDGQNKSGSGLGLAIAKDFIEAENGKIGLESAVGEGSTFYFTLPTA